MTEKTTRRDLIKPMQLIGLALLAAAFGGLVTLMSMGFFQAAGGDQRPRAAAVALIVAGACFIVTLLVIALLVLAIDPKQITAPVDRPVLYDKEDPVAADQSEPDSSDPDSH